MKKNFFFIFLVSLNFPKEPITLSVLQEKILLCCVYFSFS